MYVGIVVGNLDAVAYHLEQGIDNGGVSKEALARFLRSVARDLESTEQGHEADASRGPFTRGVMGRCERAYYEEEPPF